MYSPNRDELYLQGLATGSNQAINQVINVINYLLCLHSSSGIF